MTLANDGPMVTNLAVAWVWVLTHCPVGRAASSPPVPASAPLATTGGPALWESVATRADGPATLASAPRFRTAAARTAAAAAPVGMAGRQTPARWRSQRSTAHAAAGARAEVPLPAKYASAGTTGIR